jgi:D-3-phosphoglycerate dehydrogenase
MTAGDAARVVLLADPLTLEDGVFAEMRRAYPDVAFEDGKALAPAALATRLADGVDGLIVRSRTKVKADLLEHAGPRLRVIGRAGIGVDNIDVDAATKRGIVVMNTPGGSNVTTAEHAIAMMLALARNLPQAAAAVRAGKWPRERWMGAEVCNKVLGIVGLGNIGAIVAERALGLRMKVVAFDPFVTPEAAARLRVELVSLDELLARADFVTLHTPLTPETRGILGAERLARTKPGVRIVNCARGGLIDETALAAAIESGHVAGAALDVLAEEPPPAGHPLLQLDQVICTPHLGASTDEAQRNVAVAIAQQVAAFLTRGVIQNAVNAPSLSPEVMQVLRPYLALAEKLGALAAQLVTEPALDVTVQASGEVAERETRSLTTAVLRGLLGHILGPSVNYVNAPAIARERGIRVIESSTAQATDYLNALRVEVRTGSRTMVVAGAVFGAGTVRLTRVEDFRMEAVPEGYILMLHNRDVPGVVGAVGTLLGRHGINIAGIELGRERVGGMALSLIHVDDAVPAATLAELRTVPNIVAADLLRL